MRYFNGTGWLAIFTGTETMTGRTVHVDAWDEARGAALVVDPKRGTRRPVTDYLDFSHLEQADRVVAAIPGCGWRAYWRDEGPDSGPLTEQVLVGLVTAMGRATPITIDAHGHVDDAVSADRLIPPGGRVRQLLPHRRLSFRLIRAVQGHSERTIGQARRANQSAMNR